MGPSWAAQAEDCALLPVGRPRTWGRRPHPPSERSLGSGCRSLGRQPDPGLCVQRTETKQNKLVSWPEQRALLGRGPAQRTPGLSLLPGALAVGSHILSATFFYLVFGEIDDDCKWSSGWEGPALSSGVFLSARWPGAAAGLRGLRGPLPPAMTMPYVLSDREPRAARRASASTASRLEGAAELSFQEPSQADRCFPSRSVCAVLAPLLCALREHLCLSPHWYQVPDTPGRGRLPPAGAVVVSVWVPGHENLSPGSCVLGRGS